MAENNIGNAFTFVASPLLMLGIGIMAYKRTTNLAGYIRGGRSQEPVT